METTKYITLQIGAKIRQIRNEYNFTLSDLSQKSGVSTAMLSKIENGRLIPTLHTLIQILKSLYVDLHEFFRDLNTDTNFPGFKLITYDQLKSVSKEEESMGFHYQFIFSEMLEKSSLEISLLELLPNCKREKLTTSGMEYIYILEGEIEYELEDNRFTMKKGDSLFFDGNIPHVPHNVSDEIARILVFYFISINS